MLQLEIWFFIVMVTFSMLCIRLSIIDSLVVPKHDTGITVWWLCCIKFGQKGRYSSKEIIKEYKNLKR